MSPALAGGLFTAESPRKSLTTLVLMCFDVGRTNPFCSYYSSFTIYSLTIWVHLFLTVFLTTILVFNHIRPTIWLIYGHFYFAKIKFLIFTSSFFFVICIFFLVACYLLTDLTTLESANIGAVLGTKSFLYLALTLFLRGPLLCMFHLAPSFKLLADL